MPDARRIEMTEAEWRSEAKRLFGDDPSRWAFRCPACGHQASVADWRAAGAPETAVAFSCIGRWKKASTDAFSGKAGPCNYAGGGLFALNPVTVKFANGIKHQVFAFAEPVVPEEASHAD